MQRKFIVMLQLYLENILLIFKNNLLIYKTWQKFHKLHRLIKK